MKPTKHLLFSVLTLAALAAGAWAQTMTASNAAPPNGSAVVVAAIPAPPPVTAADVQALKDALAAQQQQIQQLTQQLQRQQALQEAQQAALNAAEKAPANPPKQIASLGIGGVNAINPVQQDAAPGQTPNPDDTPQTFNKQMEGPITIHFRGINITPGGYVEAAFIRRSRALGADLPTPYNSLTMPGASQSQIPEFFGSGRQSKTTAFIDGRMKNVDLSSYVSADFLSAGVTSTSNQTNSYTLRLRQAWAQAKFDNGWAFLGGQVWSLVTENGQGISPDDDLGRTNDSRPRTIDPSYNVGFVFARQYGIRVTKSFGNKVAIAFSVENPQATVTTHGNASNFLVGENGASNSYNTGATYSFNPAPDLIAKIAFDPGFGHYEVFGLLDRFSDRVFPCVENFASPSCGSLTAASAAGAYNASKSGGGIGASARWNIAKKVTFGLKGFGGSGIGRYAPAGLSDASINGNGTLHLIKNLEGLATFEAHLTKKLDFVGYGGVEYASRTASFDPLLNKGAGAVVGYGAPGFTNTTCYTEAAPGAGGFSPGSLGPSCTADTRAVIEGTAGFWYKFYNGPRGRFQFGADYAYVTRNAWSGVGGQPHGIDNMIFTSFRYYLP
ncbi:MAG TPA: hypothetical protein VJ999_00560 [Candidatus Sulfotelmatobacter sp.]|nr:hypothetical protein [Candidatus Sulfotelmatobacter sp.]